jgi:hypothetical protein
VSKSLFYFSTMLTLASGRHCVGAVFALGIVLCSTAGAQPHPSLSTTASAPPDTSSPSPPSAGQLVVVTTPSGALLSLDGQVIGPAPHTFTALSLGEHVVQAVWTNGRIRTTVVKVQTAAVAVNLEPEVNNEAPSVFDSAAKPRHELSGYVGATLGTRFGVNDYLLGEFLLVFEVGKSNVGFALGLGFGDATLVSPTLTLQFPIALYRQYGLYLEPGGVIGPEFGFGSETVLFARINPRLRFRWDVTPNASIVGDLISVDVIPFSVELGGSGATASGFTVAWDSLIGAHYRY